MNPLLKVDDSRLRVSEIFATIQGEGINTGVPSIFVRLSLCNLACPTCDTYYTWAWEGTTKFGTDMLTGGKIQASPAKEITEMSAKDVLDEIQRQNSTIKNIVLTGGEPLMQQGTKVFKDLLQELSQNGYIIEIETNGTLVPSETTCKYVHQFNVSPKLTSFNSVDTKDARWKSKPLMFYAEYPNTWFKFVITSQEDLEELKYLSTRYGIYPQRILLMPEGRTPEQLARNTEVIVEMCKQNGFRFCNRLHVQIYGGAIRRV